MIGIAEPDGVVITTDPRDLTAPAQMATGVMLRDTTGRIAHTGKGKFAVYIYHVNDRWPPALRVYDGLDEAQTDLQLTPEVIAMAASAMGQRRVIRRDI